MAYEYERINNIGCVTSAISTDQAVEELQEVYRKARAFDELKKHLDEEGDSYMALYRQTKDSTYSLLNSNYDNLLGFAEELERADDE